MTISARLGESITHCRHPQFQVYRWRGTNWAPTIRTPLIGTLHCFQHIQSRPSRLTLTQPRNMREIMLQRNRTFLQTSPHLKTIPYLSLNAGVGRDSRRSTRPVTAICRVTIFLGGAKNLSSSAKTNSFSHNRTRHVNSNPRPDALHDSLIVPCMIPCIFARYVHLVAAFVEHDQGLSM